MMQTTLRFDDALLRQAKAEAARKGISLTQFIEETLRQSLHSQRRDDGGRRAKKMRLPVSRSMGGFAAGIGDLKQAREVVDDADVNRVRAPRT